MNANVVILASYPKSGNTWLRVVLANLLSAGYDPIPINGIDLGNTGVGRETFDHYAGWESSDLSDSELDLLWPDVYKRWAAESQRMLFVKRHTMLYRNGAGEWIYPREIVKAVLHLVRHPFDVAVSLANHCGASFEEAVDRMLMPGYTAAKQHDDLHTHLPQRYGSWPEFVCGWLDMAHAYPVTTVRYEDLLTNPQRNFAILARAAGLEFDNPKLARAIDHSRFDRLQADEAQGGFKERLNHGGLFFRAGRSGTGREALSPALVARLLDGCGEVMGRLGYLETGEILDDVGVLAQVHKENFQNV